MDKCPSPLEAKDDLDEVLLAMTPEQAAEIAIERGVPLVDVIRAYRKILDQAVEVADISFRRERREAELGREKNLTIARLRRELESEE